MSNATIVAYPLPVTDVLVGRALDEEYAALVVAARPEMERYDRLFFDSLEDCCRECVYGRPASFLMAQDGLSESIAALAAKGGHDAYELARYLADDTYA